MVKKVRRTASILLCMALIMAAVAGIDGAVFAGNSTVKAKTVVTGNNVTATNINTSKVVKYKTPKKAARRDYSYKVKGLPEKCTVYVRYKAENLYTCSVVLKDESGRSKVKLARAVKEGDEYINEYEVSDKTTVSLNIGFSTDLENIAYFTVTYAPAKTPTLKANTKKFVKFTRGITEYPVSKFKVNVPASGYLEIYAEDYLGMGEVTVKNAGMNTCQAATAESPLYIGVKKGTYTFTINTNVSACKIRTKFHKVTESKYGAKKSKAPFIKSGKSQKGLIFANSKKVHWYKVKVAENQSGARLVVNTSKMTYGGNGGGVKLTVLFPDGGFIEKTQAAGQKTEYIVSYGDAGADALGKGTYYIKVESYNTGNGYFTFTWK